jgi:hypothetical protein
LQELRPFNRTHATATFYFLNNKTWQTQRTEKKNVTTDKEASKKNCPFLRRTFCKEVNTLACKAGKKRVLGLYAAALKREQDKESKAKVVKRCAIKAEDSLLSEIPCFIVLQNGGTFDCRYMHCKDFKMRVLVCVVKQLN